MTRPTSVIRRLRSPRRLVALVLVGALAMTTLGFTRDRAQTTVTAEFTNTAGLYVGDDVRVLGVRVGEVTAIEPQGEKVVVELAVDGDQPVPVDARAAIVSPSLVSGRFVQLEPVWTGGERLRDDARITLDRTAVPASFDDVKQELTDLASALGPGEDGQKSGPLRDAILTINANLENGNAEQLRTSLAALRDAAGSLASGREDLFGTVDNLNRFTQNLATSDAAVQGFTTKLADVSAVLRANRTELTGTIAALTTALDSVDSLLAKDRATITATVTKTNELAANLADRSNELAGVLHIAPHSLIGLHNTIEDQAINGRATLANLDSVAELLCSAILGVGGTSGQCRQALQPLLDLLGLGTLTPASAPSGGTATGTPNALPVDPGLLSGLLGLGTGSTGGTGGTGGSGGGLDLNALLGGKP